MMHELKLSLGAKPQIYISFFYSLPFLELKEASKQSIRKHKYRALPSEHHQCCYCCYTQRAFSQWLCPSSELLFVLYLQVRVCRASAAPAKPGNGIHTFWPFGVSDQCRLFQAQTRKVIFDLLLDFLTGFQLSSTMSKGFEKWSFLFIPWNLYPKGAPFPPLPSSILFLNQRGHLRRWVFFSHDGHAENTIKLPLRSNFGVFLTSFLAGKWADIVTLTTQGGSGCGQMQTTCSHSLSKSTFQYGLPRLWGICCLIVSRAPLRNWDSIGLGLIRPDIEERGSFPKNLWLEVQGSSWQVKERDEGKIIRREFVVLSIHCYIHFCIHLLQLSWQRQRF